MVRCPKYGHLLVPLALALALALALSPVTLNNLQFFEFCAQAHAVSPLYLVAADPRVMDEAVLKTLPVNKKGRKK